MGKCVDRGAKNREKAIQSSILLSLLIWVTKTDENSDKARQNIRGQTFWTFLPKILRQIKE